MIGPDIPRHKVGKFVVAMFAALALWAAIAAGAAVLWGGF